MGFAAIMQMIQLCLGIAQSVVPIVFQIEAAFPKSNIGKEVKLPLAQAIVLNAIAAAPPAKEFVSKVNLDVNKLVETVATAAIESKKKEENGK